MKVIILILAFPVIAWMISFILVKLARDEDSIIYEVHFEHSDRYTAAAFTITLCLYGLYFLYLFLKWIF